MTCLKRPVRKRNIQLYDVCSGYALKWVSTMNRSIKKIFLACQLVLFTAGAYTQESEIRFRNLALEDGLSQNTVHCIMQDAKGYIWFGTQDGLNRYDGINFKIFTSDPADSNSISHSWITALTEDSSGIWVGTLGGGLNKFNSQTETFKQYNNDPPNPDSHGSNNVWCLTRDRSGNLWIGTLDGGFCRMHPDDAGQPVFKQYINNPDNPNSLSNNRVRTIYEDRKGLLWIGTSGGGLNSFDPETEEFIHYLNDPGNNNSLCHNHVWGVFEDDNGNLWIGTYGGGLDKYNPDTKEFSHYSHKPDNPESLSSNLILSVYRDPEEERNLIWIATWGGGLNLFDIDSETFTHFRNSPADPNSIPTDNIVSVYSDYTGLMWIGTIGSGISGFVKEMPFEHYKQNPNRPGSLNNNDIGAICEDSEGNLWIGTNGAGINFLGRNKSDFIYITHSPADPGSLVNDIVKVIREDKSGTLWIGSNKGLSRLDYKNRHRMIFKNYLHDPDNPGSLSNNDISSLAIDHDGMIWIGTGGGGVNRFDPVSEQFTHYKNDPGNPVSLSDNTVLAVYIDRSGKIWIGTREGGLNMFDPGVNQGGEAVFTHYKHDPGDTNSISNNDVLSIHEDENNSLWVGTNGGLNKFDGSGSGFISFTVKEGLSDNIIYAILEDEPGNLWLSTNKGLSKFNPQNNNFTNYKVSHGLQSNEFNQASSFKSKSGKMYFGGVNGYNTFYPGDVKGNRHIPPIALTSFKKFDREVILNKDLSGSGIIEIPYRDNFFSFEFVALDYFAPEMNQYAYKMEGFDNDWIYSGTRRYASYTNLDGGDYIFRVKGSNNDGIWNEDGISLNIKIIPPFWKTLWFKILTISVAVAAALSFYFIRVNALEAQKMKLEQMVDQRTAELKETHKTMVDISRRAGMAEIASGILHNVGNVFNSINVSVNLLREKAERSKAGNLKKLSEMLIRQKSDLGTYLTEDEKGKLIPEYLDKIADALQEENKDVKHGLSSLSSGMGHIEEIIRVQQNYTGISGYRETVDVAQLVNDVIKLHRDLISQGKIKVIRKFDNEPVLKTEKVKLMQILVNIVKNAIESLTEKKEGDRIMETVISCNEKTDELCIEIIDNGTGIKKDNLTEIFTYGFSTRADHRGLGLHITALSVKELNGEILVSSDGENMGAGFKLIFSDKES